MSLENVPTNREALVEKTRQLRAAVDEQINSMQNDLSKAGRTALIAGAAVLVGYTFYRAFFSRKKVYVPVKDGQELVHIETNTKSNSLAAIIQGALTSLLLSIAREKLLQLLDAYTKSDDANTAAPTANSTHTIY